MTYLGAIKQLHELRNAEDMPIYYKPVIAEVINVLLIDAQEVRHGHWTFSIDRREGICSRCNTKIYGRPYNNTYLIVPYNYCPNCGALMDEEADE